jgi:hypothetical protein
MKFPGTYAVYALMMSVFGQSVQGIHIGFMLVNSASIFLVYLLARNLLSETAALTAGAAYALLSLSPTVLGFAAHATHFVVLPALGGVLSLLFALRNNRGYAYLLSGVFFGLALLMKQPGLFFLLFGMTYIPYHRFILARGAGRNTASAFPSSHLEITPPPAAPLPTGQAGPLKVRGGRGSYDLAFNLAIFTAGGALPLLLTAVCLYAAGAFDKFWFWTIEYASKYGSQVPLSAAFDVFKMNLAGVTAAFPLLWLLSIPGLVIMFFYKGLKGKRFFIGFFAFFSFLTICPGFYFRPHYFITLLPATAILIGVFVEWLNIRAAALLKNEHLRSTGAIIFLLAAGLGIAPQRAYLFEDNPAKLARTVYGANPFPESLEIAKFIGSHSAAADRVAVFGSEPQLFFYSGRQSATGYIYVYSLMEKHEFSLSMQQEMIREVESSNPKFIVMVKIATSWLKRPDSEKYIFGWMNDYVGKNYSLVGVADIISPDLTVYKWYGDAKGYAIQSPYHVLIFEKKGK